MQVWMLNNIYDWKVSSALPMAGSWQPLFDVRIHFHSAVIEMIGVCNLVYALNVYTIRGKKANFFFFLYEKRLKLSPVFAQCLPILLCKVADPAILTSHTPIIP